MSDTAPDTGTDTPTPDVETDTDTTDYKAEAERWKSLARKHEDRAKANADAAKELEQVRQSSMSETEKAVALAKAEGRAEAIREVGLELVDAAVQVAAAGRNVDVDALLEGMDRTRFLNDEGKPDSKAIAAWVDRIAPKPEESQDDLVPSGMLDLGQGSRRSSTPLNGDALERDLRRALRM